MGPSPKIPKDVWWVLGIGSQAGLALVCPVLLGLAAGYWLDRQLGTLPWLSLGFTCVGAILGPVMVYRWVIAQVNLWTKRQDRPPGEK